ncbi:hypothetical protein FF38_09893 [Lucilia cuprina]|uniref:Uncharacterized protein n=1 Tax=Lucilia cuprina TaxID=7375 RepID=A0A0L0CPT8_LUCCU|nr:hypothetical protein FF38_09893 [Lucilia cuprina]
MFTSKSSHLPKGGCGAVRKPELMASCDWAKGVRIVPKCCCVGNTIPPTSVLALIGELLLPPGPPPNSVDLLGAKLRNDPPDAIDDVTNDDDDDDDRLLLLWLLLFIWFIVFWEFMDVVDVVLKCTYFKLAALLRTLPPVLILSINLSDIVGGGGGGDCFVEEASLLENINERTFVEDPLVLFFSRRESEVLWKEEKIRLTVDKFLGGCDGGCGGGPLFVFKLASVALICCFVSSALKSKGPLLDEAVAEVLLDDGGLLLRLLTDDATLDAGAEI